MHLSNTRKAFDLKVVFFCNSPSNYRKYFCKNISKFISQQIKRMFDLLKSSAQRAVQAHALSTSSQDLPCADVELREIELLSLQLCGVAYCDIGSRAAHLLNLGFELLCEQKTWFLCKTGPDLSLISIPGFVVFRGTHSVQDVLVDAAVQPTPFIGANRFHSGFYNSIIDDTVLRTALNTNVQRKGLQKEAGGPGNWVFTGHSLGGAKAQLAMILLENGLLSSQDSNCTRETGWDKLESVVFAAPPIYFAKNCHPEHNNITHFVFGQDPVPRLDRADDNFLLSALSRIEGAKKVATFAKDINHYYHPNGAKCVWLLPENVLGNFFPFTSKVVGALWKAKNNPHGISGTENSNEKSIFKTVANLVADVGTALSDESGNESNGNFRHILLSTTAGDPWSRQTLHHINDSKIEDHSLQCYEAVFKSAFKTEYTRARLNSPTTISPRGADKKGGGLHLLRLL